MKKIYFIAIIFMASSYAFAQTSLNPKKLIGTVTDVSFTSTAPSSTFNRDYNKNNFLLAWNWGHPNHLNPQTPGRNLDVALNINSNHQQAFINGTSYVPLTTSNIASNYAALTTITDNSTVISGLNRSRYTSRTDINNFNGLGIYLEPALTVDENSSFVPNTEADYGSSYGFKSKIGSTYGANSQIAYSDGKTYGCFSLLKTSVGSSTITVLDDIWRGDMLRYCNYGELRTITQSSNTINYGGVNWKFSINLRNTDEFTSGGDDEVVLRLSIPYTLSNNWKFT